MFGHFWTNIDPHSTKIGKAACYFFQDVHFSRKKRIIAYPEAHVLFAAHKPPEAALAADKTSVVSAAKKAFKSAATSDVRLTS